MPWNRPTRVLLPLLACALLAPATRAAAQEATLRLISPVAGQEVVVRILESQEQAGTDRNVTVLGANGRVVANGAIELATPIDIRLDPVEAFRVTFSTVSPQQLLRVLLTPAAEQELFVDGAEVILVRRSAGSVVELEANVPDEEENLPVHRARRAPERPAGPA
jgi:hypothetical protein